MASNYCMVVRVIGRNGLVKRITIDFDDGVRFVENAGDHVVTIHGAVRMSQSDDFDEIVDP